MHTAGPCFDHGPQGQQNWHKWLTRWQQVENRAPELLWYRADNLSK